MSTESMMPESAGNDAIRAISKIDGDMDAPLLRVRDFVVMLYSIDLSQDHVDKLADAVAGAARRAWDDIEEIKEIVAEARRGLADAMPSCRRVRAASEARKAALDAGEEPPHEPTFGEVSAGRAMLAAVGAERTDAEIIAVLKAAHAEGSV